MSGLRPPSTPRASLLPTPGGTPGTARRKSAIARPPSAQAFAANEMSSLRQAISANDPSSYSSPASDAGDDSPYAVGIALGGHLHEGSSGSNGGATRQAVLPGASRTGSAAGARPTGSARGVSRPSTPSGPHTPKTPTYARSRTPTGFGSSTNRFAGPLPLSKPDEPAQLAVGSEVTFEVAGEKMEGVLRFLGEIEGKAGSWGGVELDSTYAGKGKNDGSVAGVQYFACPPACGLFLAMSKITAKPKPKSSNPPLTAGSRAAKYAGMNAKDLASRRLSASTATPSSKATPRRSLSPTKPRTSLSPTKRLSTSTSTLTTPKPTTRLARPSLGGASLSTPTTARKSLGGPSATPRASMGGAASIKRPASSLRQHASAPDVPPIPSAYGLARSVTPSSMSGRITPSTPGAMMKNRRTSLAQSETSSARPTTPSVRSYSRQSFASSVSRQSHRSTASTSHDADDFAELRTELEEAKQREADIRQLLEGSERLGREMEDRLTEKNEQVKAAEERVALLEQERERVKADEEKRLAGVQGDEADLDRERARTRELEARLAETEKALDAQWAATDKLRLEEKHKSAAKEAEVEKLRERLSAQEDERADLNTQVDKLRTAGQALCETYEEKIAEIELARLEAVELAETLQLQLDGQPAPPSSASRSNSPTLSRSLSSSHASAAEAIDAENTRAELEHLRSKVSTLEEQLEDARMALEQEVTDAKKRRTRAGEVEALLKGEIKSLKEALDRSAKAEQRSAARLQELQEALHESQATLEAERSELEGLRHDASGDATASLADDLKRVHKELASTRSQLEAAERDAGLVSELREDLRNAEKEIERLQKLSTPPELGGRRVSTGSVGGKDEATATRDQIVGLKTIITTLTEENQQLVEKNKELEGKTEELSDSQKALEATVENLMTQLDAPSSPSADRSPSSKGDVSLRRELEQLKIELKEVQRKSEREIKALNQEVTELESLVESKIYREDELETELERYKSLASSNGHHTSSPSSAPYLNGNGNGSANKALDAGSETDGEAGEGECEMCGRTGHDLDACPEFSGSPTKSAASRRGSLPPATDANGAAEYCDDCEEYGHSLENCPLAAEIF
ncbi:hypothetical protein JCM6882_004944 [Rhodosporidiobolus microsporus]